MNVQFLPKISIITVVYNNEEYIEQCIQSVLSQTYQNREHIIIDGNSTDRTPEIIDRYGSNFEVLITESDDGIGDAMNKGIRAAKGEFLIFLHSDDYFYQDSSLGDAVAYLESETEILFCGIIFGAKKIRRVPRGLDWRMYFKSGVLHQGCLCRRTLFEEYGAFDTTIKIAMDYDFFLRLYLLSVTWKQSPVTLTRMRDTGISSRKDWPSLLQRFSDEREVHLKHCDSSYKRLIYLIYWPVYLTYRKLLHIFLSMR